MTAGQTRGRRPADHPQQARQAMWLALKQMPDRITTAAVAERTGLSRSTAQRYFKALTAAGYLAFDPPAPGQIGIWRLLNDVGHHAPRVREDGSRVVMGDIRQQLWRSMYMLRDFSYADLIHNASMPITEASSRAYCGQLLAAGYLRVLRKANPSKAQLAIYRLVRNTGPRAPQVQRVEQVFDPNTGAIYGIGGSAVSGQAREGSPRAVGA